MSATGSISNAKPRILLQFTQNKEGSVPAIRTVQDGPTTEEEYEDEDDGEDEVDQLVSTEDEGPPKAGTSASAAGASKPPRVRSQKVSVQPPIPLARLEGILDTEIGETMSKEAMFVLSAATDAFIKRMAEVGHRKANSMRRTTVTYHDMASAVHQQPELRFLEETIPQPLGLAEALRLREAKGKALLQPLLSTPAPPRPFAISVPSAQSLSITLPARSISVSASASGSNAPSPAPLVLPNTSISAWMSKPSTAKGKRKANQLLNGDMTPPVNGVPSASSTSMPVAVNGTAAAPLVVEPVSVPAPQPRRMSMREPKPRRRPDEGEDSPRPPPAPPTSPVKETTTGKTRPSRAKTAKGKAKAAAAAAASASAPVLTTAARNGVNHAHTNGKVTMTTRSRRGSNAVVQPPAPPAEAGLQRDEPKWAVVECDSGHLSGPGSGFLDGPGALARNGYMENPGRTIYSSQRQPDTTASW